MSTELENRDFAAGVGTWDTGTAPTHQAAVAGPDDALGVARFAVNNSATPARFEFGTQTGKVRVSFDVKVNDSVVAASSDTVFYVLPDAVATASGNSAAAFFVSRNSTNNATTSLYALTYRSGASFVAASLLPRSAWVNIAVVVDVSAKTYDLYVGGRLWLRGLAFPDAAIAEVRDFAVINSSASCSTDIDNLEIVGDWTEPTRDLLIDTDFTAFDGEEIEDTSPTTDDRWPGFSQPWLIPADQTTFGGFTCSATNGAEPDSAKDCLAMVRGVEDEFDLRATWTLAASGQIYAGIMFRVWAGLDGDSYLVLRYNSSATAGTQLALLQGGTSLQASAGTAGGVSWSAGASNTLKVIVRGRVIDCYVNDVLQFSHTVTTDATGARGQLSEEHVGIYTEAAGNYCTAFSLRGVLPETETDFLIGDRRYQLCATQVRGMIDGSVSSTRNLGWSKFIQAVHMSEADGNETEAFVTTPISTTNCRTIKQLTNCLKETKYRAFDAEAYWTFTRRGVWLREALTVFTEDVGINFTPDTDLRPDLWSKTFLTAGAGATTSRDVSGFQNWTNYETAASHAAQAITNVGGSAEMRMSIASIPLSGMPATRTNTAKFRGVGDPISIVVGNAEAADIAVGDVLVLQRSYLMETGSLSLDATTCTGWRDDCANPDTLTMTTGTAKTDADGDTDTDGFNERHGWYEVNAADGELDFSIDGSTHERYQPQFRINGYRSSHRRVLIDGVDAVAGEDYFLDATGDGNAILQLTGTYSTATSVAVSLSPSSTLRRAVNRAINRAIN